MPCLPAPGLVYFLFIPVGYFDLTILRKEATMVLKRRVILWMSICCILCIALFACGGGSRKPVDGSSGDGISDDGYQKKDGVERDASNEDSLSSTDSLSDLHGMKRDYGEPCVENKTASAVYCVASQKGFICSKICEDSCPEVMDMSMECRLVINSIPDNIYICVPSAGVICQPCLTDAHCFGHLCVELSEGIHVCGKNCERREGLPGKYILSPHSG